MPLYLNEEQAITFLHIPKTGGTTIESWLNESGKYQQIFFSQKTLQDMLVTPQHLGSPTLTELTRTLERPFEYKFAVVRNPFDRIISEFFYRIKLGSIQLGERAESLFSPWVINSLKNYKKNHQVLDNHLRPQTYYVNADVEIFKFEDGIKNILDTVGKRIGMQGNGEVKPQKVGEKKSVRWSPTAIKMVLELYSQDFDRFDYPTSISHLNIEASTLRIKKNEAKYTSKIIKKKVIRKFK